MATDLPTRRPTLTRKTLQVAIGVLTLLLVTEVAVLVSGRGSGGTGAAADAGLRNEVKRVASSFAVNVNTYSAGDVRSYRKTVEPLLTDTFAKSFGASMRDVVSRLKSAEVESAGEVRAAAVSSVDKDSAVVLVVCDADVSTSYGERQRHFRWRVDLVRAGSGKPWLVDEFTPV